MLIMECDTGSNWLLPLSVYQGLFHRYHSVCHLLSNGSLLSVQVKVVFNNSCLKRLRLIPGHGHDINHSVLRSFESTEKTYAHMFVVRTLAFVMPLEKLIPSVFLSHFIGIVVWTCGAR